MIVERGSTRLKDVEDWLCGLQAKKMGILCQTKGSMVVRVNFIHFLLPLLRNGTRYFWWESS